MLVLLVLLLTDHLSVKTHAEDIVPDISSDPFVFVADRLPTTEGQVNYRYLPAIGNGHLATIVYSDTIYVNGMYNGWMNESARARVPSYHAMKLMPNDARSPRRFTFNITNGVFREDINTSAATVTFRTYAHLFYNRVLISDLTIVRNCSLGDIVVEWNSLQGSPTTDFNLSKSVPHGKNSVYEHGSTKEAESSDTGRTTVHIYRSLLPNRFILSAKDKAARYCVALAIDQSQAVSEEFYDAVITLAGNGKCQDLLDNHTSLWQRIWAAGQIDIDYEQESAKLLHLRKVILSSQYFLYSGLPSTSTYKPNNQFYGLSPGGLSTGTRGQDYFGHVFWDMETWMYPPILMLRPDWAKDMLSYRFHTMTAAASNAKKSGYEGIRYPWESAYSGHEVSPSAECGNYEQHITGDIAFAARQYVSATRDMKWLNDPQSFNQKSGFDLLVETARFWISRLSSGDSGKYNINGVMPPDENHSRVNNSIFTNAVALSAVCFARYAACLSGRNSSDVPSEWADMVENLTFTYNKEKQYHEEFQGFDKLNSTGKLGKVKQADVVLLEYPLLFQMPKSVRANDLNFYEALTESDGPAMTWGMFSVGWLDLNNDKKALDLFNRSFKPYVRQPFKIWTEVSGGLGAVNFQTGMGGFLQAVISGYGGIRLQVESLQFQQPRLIPGTSKLTFKNLNYLGTVFDYVIETSHIQLTVRSIGSIQLSLNASGIVSDLKPGVVNFPGGSFSVFPTKPSGCELPPTRLPIHYKSK